MIKKCALQPDALRWRCNPNSVEVLNGSKLPEKEITVGQERAMAALTFGADIKSDGYNAFVMGPSGTGRNISTRALLREKAAGEPAPDDWCYVYNFANARAPRALRLPAGMGSVLREDMSNALEEAQQVLSGVFESDGYVDKRDEIVKEFRDERNRELQKFEQEAQSQGFALGRSPAGLIVAPAIDGEVMSPQQYNELEKKERERLDEEREELQARLGEIMRRSQREEKDTRERVRRLDQQVAHDALVPVFEDLFKKYQQVKPVLEHLQLVEKDIVENVHAFRRSSDDEEGPQLPFMPMMGGTQRNLTERYSINVLVANDPEKGAPLIYEANPTIDKLTGEIEHQAQMGAMITDYTMIGPGALHRANGGYLIVEALPLLMRPFAWEALKRALKNREVRIESISDQYRIISTVTLEPEPIPLDVKVVIIGSPFIYYLLHAYDEDFAKLFKVQADFSSDMPRTDEAVQQYAQFVSHICAREKLHPFTRPAMARMVEFGAETAGDQQKLSTRLMEVADLIREASYWAIKHDHKSVRVDDVEYAIEQKIWRANQLEERIFEMIEDGTIMVDTEGEVVGQINGLSITQLGEYMMGRPNRITCRTFAGRGGVIQIDREAKLTGRIHDKGVLTLQGFLGERFGTLRPLSLSATLSFEQMYSGIDGDSASSTELYCLLSSLSEVPIRQGIAVTGSVNQRGEVQPIGGVTRKIEGFYLACKKKGLTGEQGVIIPNSNVRQLMLKKEIVDAVKKGRFHIWQVSHVDEGIEILTGVPAGEQAPDGTFPEDSINGRVQARLDAFNTMLREYGPMPEPRRSESDSECDGCR